MSIVGSLSKWPKLLYTSLVVREIREKRDRASENLVAPNTLLVAGSYR